MKSPHIIIFNPDQWRGDVLGHMGNAAAVTPNLDRLVETDAVSFSAAFCQNTVCTPSRCSFMTGWYPHVRGHQQWYPIYFSWRERGWNTWNQVDLQQSTEGLNKSDTFDPPIHPPRQVPHSHGGPIL